MFEGIDTLEILKNGLPKGENPQEITIVGSGISGLIAGKLLSDAGHDVTILEAQHRPGGRIFTQHLECGRFTEMGAMRFSTKHLHAVEIIRQFDLNTSLFPLKKKQLYLNNKLLDLENALPREVGFDVTDNENIPPTEILKKLFNPVYRYFDREDSDEVEAWNEMLNRYNGLSILDFFKENDLSEGLIAFISLLNNIEGRLGFNFAEWAEYVRQDAFGDNLFYLTDGAESLIHALAKPLLDRIKFGCVVTEINQSLTRATVNYLSAGKMHQISTDQVLMAIPPIVLRRIPVEGFDNKKMSAIRAAYHGRAAKVFLQYNKRWWEDRGFGSGGGMTITDLSCRNIVFTVAGQGWDNSRGVIIGSYTWEADSMVLSCIHDQDRVQKIMEDVAEIYPESRQYFEFGISYDWASDRWAGGVGGLFRPHEMTSAHYRNLLRPVSRVWNCGDTYDRRHRRWIEGAIRSAVKNAFAVNMNMKELPWLD